MKPLLAILAICLFGAAGSAGAVEIQERWVEYRNGDVDVPALLLLPKATGPHSAVLYIHGRSGLNGRVQGQARRLASRGFAVLAPDYHTGRFIPENPIEHDPATEKDVEQGLEFLATLPDVQSQRICVVGLSRGGYHAALLAVRRTDRIVCMVGYYPHLVNPNAPEPVQVYRYMPEIEKLDVPTLLFVGEREQELRRTLVIRVAERLKARGRPVELYVYPGAQRAFDFRTANRSLGDDLAREHALDRTTEFLRRMLNKKERK